MQTAMECCMHPLFLRLAIAAPALLLCAACATPAARPNTTPGHLADTNLRVNPSAVETENSVPQSTMLVAVNATSRDANDMVHTANVQRTSAYYDRENTADDIQTANALDSVPQNATSIPQAAGPDGGATADQETDRWWAPQIQSPLRENTQALPITVDELIVRALNHSSQIKVFSQLPLIRQTSIVEADAAFDWHGFLDTRWDDISDPVGN
ncbi:MAG: hypothetical protein AAFP90_19065, partial [Planctomycetota bacterium]